MTFSISRSMYYRLTTRVLVHLSWKFVLNQYAKNQFYFGDFECHFYFQNEVLISIADLYEEHNQCSQGHSFCS